MLYAARSEPTSGVATVHPVSFPPDGSGEPVSTGQDWGTIAWPLSRLVVIG